MFRTFPEIPVRSAGKRWIASGNLRVCGIWLAGLLCLLAMLWQLTRMALAEEKALLTERSREKAAALAKGYTRQLSRSLDQIDQAALALQYDWTELHRPALLERRLRRMVRPSAGL